VIALSTGESTTKLPKHALRRTRQGNDVGPCFSSMPSIGRFDSKDRSCGSTQGENECSTNDGICQDGNGTSRASSRNRITPQVASRADPVLNYGRLRSAGIFGFSHSLEKPHPPAPSPTRRGGWRCSPSFAGRGLGGRWPIFRTDAHAGRGATAHENSVSAQCLRHISQVGHRIYRTDAHAGRGATADENPVSAQCLRHISQVGHRIFRTDAHAGRGATAQENSVSAQCLRHISQVGHRIYRTGA
jgi:ribosomal protein L28